MKFIIAHNSVVARDCAREHNLKPNEYRVVLPTNWFGMLRGRQIDVDDIIWAPPATMDSDLRFPTSLWDMLRIVTFSSRRKRSDNA
jgi:hypothetical protein